MTGDRANGQYLLRLAADRSSGGRTALAVSLIDLLAEPMPDPSDREAALIGDILTRLLRDFGTAVRRDLAIRLARLDRAPREAVVALANDESEVAAPLLRHSRVLRDLDLIEIVRCRSRRHHLSIALRDRVGEAVSHALAATGDEAVITSLLANETARISDATLADLVEDARRIDGYRDPLVRREDLSEPLAKRLYGFVSSDLRERILQRFGLEPEQIAGESGGLPDASTANMARVDNVVPINSAPDRLARALVNANEVTANFLVKVLRAGKADLFEALAEELTGVSARTLRTLLYDSSGMALAILCRALGISKKHFLELYLLARRTQPGSEPAPTRDLATVILAFDRLSQASALEAVAAWRGDGKPAASEEANRSVS